MLLKMARVAMDWTSSNLMVTSLVLYHWAIEDSSGLRSLNCVLLQFLSADADTEKLRGFHGHFCCQKSVLNGNGTFYGVLPVVYESWDHEKLWAIILALVKLWNVCVLCVALNQTAHKNSNSYNKNRKTFLSGINILGLRLIPCS